MLNFNEFIVEQNEIFSIEVLNTLTTFIERKKYCDKFFKFLGRGSSRIAYDYTDDKVLKLALNNKGIEQNEVEDDWYIQKYGFITKIIENSTDYFWLISDKADKCTIKNFKTISEIEFNDFIQYCKYFQYLQYPKKYIHFKNVNISNDIIEKIEQSEFFQEFFDYIMSYDILNLIFEFSNIKNWGIVKNNLVIIDYGLTNHIFDNFYKK